MSWAARFPSGYADALQDKTTVINQLCQLWTLKQQRTPIWHIGVAFAAPESTFQSPEPALCNNRQIQAWELCAPHTATHQCGLPCQLWTLKQQRTSYDIVIGPLLLQSPIFRVQSQPSATTGKSKPSVDWAGGLLGSHWCVVHKFLRALSTSCWTARMKNLVITRPFSGTNPDGMLRSCSEAKCCFHVFPNQSMSLRFAGQQKRTITTIAPARAVAVIVFFHTWRLALMSSPSPTDSAKIHQVEVEWLNVVTQDARCSNCLSFWILHFKPSTLSLARSRSPSKT